MANRLSELGEREKALVAAQEAVTLCRGLAAQSPDAFNPDLAMSLNNLANRLSELGEREKALVAVQQAVTLYRGLAAQRPDAFNSDLAGSLSSLAITLHEMGELSVAIRLLEVVLQRSDSAASLTRREAETMLASWRIENGDARGATSSLDRLLEESSGEGWREAALLRLRAAKDLGDFDAIEGLLSRLEHEAKKLGRSM